MILFRRDSTALITQHCYRTLLLALSRPGMIRYMRCPDGADMDMFAHLSFSPFLAAVVYTLLDEGVTLAPGDPDSRHWIAEIAACTGVRIVPTEEADFVLCAAVPQVSLFHSLKKGSLLNPEDGSTLVFRSREPISGSSGIIEISGPGVDSFISFHASRSTLEIIHNRMQVKFEYPMGFDVFVIGSDGGVLGLPRTSSVKILSN